MYLLLFLAWGDDCLALSWSGIYLLYIESEEIKSVFFPQLFKVWVKRV